MNAKHIRMLALLLAPWASLAWNPGGHVWNGAAGDNDLDNAANWVTNKTNGGFSTMYYAVDTPPGADDVVIFPYGDYHFTLGHDYTWGFFYCGYGTASKAGDFEMDLNGHTLTLNNSTTFPGMESNTDRGLVCATNYVFRNGRIYNLSTVNPGGKRVWSFIDCPEVTAVGTDWGANAGAVHIDHSKVTLTGSMRYGRGLRFAVSNGSEVVANAFTCHGSQGANPGDNHLLVSGAGTTFTCKGDLKLVGDGNSVQILDGASATGSMLGLRSGNSNATNFLFEVRNASFKETGDNTGYRGRLGCPWASTGCRIIFDHPVSFSVPTGLEMCGVSNELHMAGRNIVHWADVVTMVGRDNAVTLDDGAFVRTLGGSFNFSGARRPNLTVARGAWLEASTNIVNRPLCYTNSADVAINVLDGGHVLVWSSPFSIDGTNTVVCVSNGTFHVRSCWASGACSITPLGAGFGFQSTFDAWWLTSGGLPGAVHSPAIELAGKDAKFLVTGRFIAGRRDGDEGVGRHPAELRFTVPPEGWAEAPLSVEESVDASLNARRSSQTTIRDEVVFKVDARKFISANRASPNGKNPFVVPLVRGATNLTAQSTLKYTWSADVEALGRHAVFQPADRLHLVDHKDANGNVVGIDLAIDCHTGLMIFVR